MLASWAMELGAYLDRINFATDVRPDRTTLNALMRAHLSSVPFENLDQQFRRPVSTDAPSAYAKVVGRRRGGWCFELNALFGWALSEIGFDVHNLAGHVGRKGSGRTLPADHKFLLVNCDEPLLVDVGFGGSLLEPVPLAPGEAWQAPYRIEITKEDQGYLRFTERADGEPSWFDFRPTPVGDNHFDATSARLQTDGSSPFRRTLTIQRRYEDHHIVLRGRVLRIVGIEGTNECVLPSSEELVSCLHDQFGLDVPEVASLWPRIKARHDQLFGR